MSDPQPCGETCWLSLCVLVRVRACVQRRLLAIPIVNEKDELVATLSASVRPQRRTLNRVSSCRLLAAPLWVRTCAG